MIQAFLLYFVLLAHIPIFFSDIFHVFPKCLGRLITYNSSHIFYGSINLVKPRHFFFEVPVPGQEIEWSCNLCVNGIDFASLYVFL